MLFYSVTVNPSKAAPIAAFLRSGVWEIDTLDAVSALEFLNQWGFTGVRSGRVEFYKGHNSETISVEVDTRVEPISDREFLNAYGNRDFQVIETEELA